MSDSLSIVLCKKCQTQIRATDYFCFNCGKEQRPKPLSTNLIAELVLLVKCILLPPFGIIWGIQYLRQSDTKSKLSGLMAILVTIVVSALAIKFTIDAINSFNSILTTQLQGV